MVATAKCNRIINIRALEVLKGKPPIRKHETEAEFYASYADIAVKDIQYLSQQEHKSDVFNSDYQPRYILSLDHSQNTVVLAFRGTLSVRDVIVDLAGESVEFEVEDGTYFLHAGMLKVIAKVTTPAHASGIHSKVSTLLDQNPTYNLTITGHSLGGGLASVLGVLWADPLTGFTRPSSGLRHCSVRVYAFACASVMEDSLSQLYKNVIMSVVIGWDWLARVTKAGVVEIRDAAVKLREADLAEPGLLDSILSGSCTDDELVKCYDLRTRITKEHLPAASERKIHPPGRSIWIYSFGSRFELYSVRDRAKVFGEILFDEKMTSHHHPTAYDEIFGEM